MIEYIHIINVQFLNVPVAHQIAASHPLSLTQFTISLSDPKSHFKTVIKSESKSNVSCAFSKSRTKAMTLYPLDINSCTTSDPMYFSRREE